MKKAIVFMIMAFRMFSVSGQTTADSATTHLQLYKQWFDQGLINLSEYEQLKAKTLNLSEPVPASKNTIKTMNTMQDYKQVYRIAFLGGGILEGLGAFSMISAYKWNQPSALWVLEYGPEHARTYTKNVMIGVGSVFLATGTSMIVIGGVTYHKYRELKIKASLNTVGLSYKF